MSSSGLSQTCLSEDTLACCQKPWSSSVKMVTNRCAPLGNLIGSSNSILPSRTTARMVLNIATPHDRLRPDLVRSVGTIVLHFEHVWCHASAMGLESTTRVTDAKSCRPTPCGSVAVLRPSPTPTKFGLRWIPKRKKAPISRAARRSTATACWAGPGSGFTYRISMVLYSWLWNENTTHTHIVLNLKHYFDQATATLFAVGSLVQAIHPRHRNNWQRCGRVLLTYHLL